ncbi:MAG: peptide deformylase [Shimia sp.]
MREILRYPHPILRRPAEEVPEITDDIRAVWAEMIAVMEAMPGIGLAAPQIGVPLRLAVVDASRERGKAIRMANPVILAASKEIVAGTEASPCLPGITAKVERPRAVTVRFLNEAGQVDRRDLVLQWGRSVQHQIDHLDGKLFVDRLSRVKRDMLLRKAAKAG